MLPPKLLGVHLDVIHFFAFVAFSISSFVFMHVTFIDIVTFLAKFLFVWVIRTSSLPKFYSFGFIV